MPWGGMSGVLWTAPEGELYYTIHTIRTYSHPGSDPGGVLGAGDEASFQGRLSPRLPLSEFHVASTPVNIESFKVSVSPSRFDGTAKECGNIVVTVMQGRVHPRRVDACRQKVGPVEVAVVLSNDQSSCSRDDTLYAMLCVLPCVYPYCCVTMPCVRQGVRLSVRMCCCVTVRCVLVVSRCVPCCVGCCVCDALCAMSCVMLWAGTLCARLRVRLCVRCGGAVLCVLHSVCWGRLRCMQCCVGPCVCNAMCAKPSRVLQNGALCALMCMRRYVCCCGAVRYVMHGVPCCVTMFCGCWCVFCCSHGMLLHVLCCMCLPVCYSVSAAVCATLHEIRFNNKNRKISATITRRSPRSRAAVCAGPGGLKPTNKYAGPK